MIAAGLKGPSARGTLEERDRSDITCGRKPKQTWLIKTAGILSVRAPKYPSESAWLKLIFWGGFFSYNQKGLDTVVVVCFFLLLFFLSPWTDKPFRSKWRPESQEERLSCCILFSLRNIMQLRPHLTAGCMTNSGCLLLLANWIRLNNQSCNAFLEHTEAASSVSYHISVKEKKKKTPYTCEPGVLICDCVGCVWCWNYSAGKKWR